MFIFSVFIAFIGSFLYGYTTCVIAGAILFISKQLSLSPLQEGMLVSISLFGAMTGVLVGGKLTTQIKKKQELRIAGLFFIIGTSLSIFDQYEVLLLGRLITGIGMGFVTLFVPIYLAEISHEETRGRVGSTISLGITFGLFIAYLINYFLSYTENWQLMFGFALIPAAGLFLGSFFLLEPPNEILNKTKKPEKISLLNPSVRSIVLIGAVFSFFQQITGINAVNYYAPSIFQTSGFTSPSMAIFITLGNGLIILTVAILLIITGLIDKLGRRPLLLFSTGMMATSLIVFSNAFLTQSDHLALISAITLPTFTASFTAGLGPVMWVYLPELFPEAIRGKAMSLALFLNMSGNYLISLIFPEFVEIWGVGVVFGIFAALLITLFFFVIFLLPETKGKKII